MFNKKREVEKIVCIFVIVIVGLNFFYTIWNVWLTTHDDIMAYMNARLNNIWTYGNEMAKSTGRFFYIYSVFLNCLPYVFNSYLWMKLLQYTSLIFSLFAMWKCINKHLDHKFAALVVLTFLGFAQIDNQHNAFISFILYMQIGMGFIFLSISFFLDYLKEDRNNKLVLSAVLYAVPLFIYEAYLCYFPIYFILAYLFCNRKNKNFFARNIFAIKKVIYHSVVVIIFLMLYEGLKVKYPGEYSGSDVGLLSTYGTIKTILYFGMGLFPSRVWVKTFGLKGLGGVLPNIRISDIGIAIILALTLIMLLYKMRKLETKTLVYTIFTCGIAIFLPCIPYSITTQYVNWVQTNSIYGYVPSFFAYFFICILLVALAKYIYQIIPIKKIFLVIIFFCIFSVTILTNVSNRYYKELFCAQQQRYKAFDTVVSSDPFLSIEEGSIVYIPDYSGIHNSMEMSEKYLKIYSDKKVTLVNQKSDIDFSRPVYELRYCGDVSVFAKINQKLYSQKLYIYSNINENREVRLTDGKNSIVVDCSEKLSEVHQRVKMKKLIIE